MNIRDFKYIIAIDELRSFVKASQKCFVSQPALSMQMQKIEDLLGIKIFERDKRTVLTTPEGKQVVEYAKSMLEIFNSIKSIGNSSTKNVRIGLIYTISNYLLPKIMPMCSANEDGIDYTFFEDKTANLVQDLNTGKLDGILLASGKSCKKNEFNTSSSVKEHSLYKEKLTIVLPQNHEFNSDNKKISNKEFKTLITNNNFILLEEGNCLTDHINQIVSKYGAELNQKKSNLFTPSIETILQMILNNNGISILPKSSVEGMEGVKYFEMPNSESRAISLLYRKNTSKLPNLLEMAEGIKSII